MRWLHIRVPASPEMSADEAALLGEAYADKRVFAKLLAVSKVLRQGNVDFVLVIDADAIVVEASWNLDALVATIRVPR